MIYVGIVIGFILGCSAMRWAFRTKLQAVGLERGALHSDRRIENGFTTGRLSYLVKRVCSDCGGRGGDGRFACARCLGSGDVWALPEPGE